MGRMLEAIKQIEAKGPPPPAGRIRPTRRQRNSSGPGRSGIAPAMSPSIDDDPSSLPRTVPSAIEPELLQSPVADPMTNEPFLAEMFAAEMLLAETPVEAELFASPAIANSRSAQAAMVAPPMPVPDATLSEQAAPSDEVRRVAAAMMAHVPAFSSGVVALAAAEPTLETTPVSAALAHALAAGPKHEVLLVDARADRNPGRLAEYWGGLPGLQDVLRRQATWHETVRPTAVRGLSILEAGTPGDPSPAEQWRLLWNDLKRRFRFILLDCGPAFSVADWSSTVDAMYLLVELDRTARWAAEQSARHLRGCGARLAGSLLLDGQMRS